PASANPPRAGAPTRRNSRRLSGHRQCVATAFVMSLPMKSRSTNQFHSLPNDPATCQRFVAELWSLSRRWAVGTAYSVLGTFFAFFIDIARVFVDNTAQRFTERYSQQMEHAMNVLHRIGRFALVTTLLVLVGASYG